MEYDKITTPCGPVEGVLNGDKTMAVYKGIRYGSAGRFEYPVKVCGWDGIYRADTFGDCSYQPRAFYCEADVPEKAFYYHEFREGETYTYSEDCLFLNVWAPVGAKDAPVLFYIHGGGFKGGCGHEKHFDGSAYCKQGVIVVTINYRLGPLGFACLSERAAGDGHTGNYGLYDQYTALSWVRDNIRFFGGDPERITIMGQSAGAMSVQQHCLSPMTDGMFGGAIMMSGGGVAEPFAPAVKAEDACAFWDGLDRKLREKYKTSMMDATPETLFEAFDAYSRETKGSFGFCGPVIDGEYLTEPAMVTVKAGRAKAVPYLMGSTSEDIVPPIVHKMAKGWARLQADAGRCKSYAFFFDRQLPGDDCGAWHSADLWYEFGTLSKGWRPFTDWDYRLSDVMVRYFSNFIKTGDPNGEHLVPWLPMEKGQNLVMRFGDKSVHMGGVSIARLKHTMMTKPAVGE